VSGGVVMVGGSVLLWFSRKQTMIATSTTEAETHAAMEMSYSLMIARNLVAELWNVQLHSIVTTMFVDNQPAIDAIGNGRGRTRHYDVKLKFIQQCLIERKFQLKKIDTKQNLADILTKPLRKLQFEYLSDVILSNDQISGISEI
jgi:hypothetical protein